MTFFMIVTINTSQWSFIIKLRLLQKLVAEHLFLLEFLNFFTVILDNAYFKIQNITSYVIHVTYKCVVVKQKMKVIKFLLCKKVVGQFVNMFLSRSVNFYTFTHELLIHFKFSRLTIRLLMSIYGWACFCSEAHWCLTFVKIKFFLFRVANFMPHLRT